MGPHSGSEPAAYLEDFCTDAAGVWMRFPSGWWKLLAAWVKAGTGPSSCVSLRLLVEVFRRVFLSFVLAQFALGTWYIISFALRILLSRSLCVRVAFGVQLWIFREILQLLVGAFLGSTVDTCSASVLGVWKNCTHFLRCGRLES